MPITWITEEVVRTLHSELLAEHGGPQGPGPGSLAGCLARPQNHLAYAATPPSVIELAAYYGIALARGHCFADGNKRVALAAIDVFLQLNDYELTAAADSPQTASFFEALAEGRVDVDEVVNWIEANCAPLENP